MENAKNGVSLTPKLMRMSVLTAAIQYPNISREEFRENPIGSAQAAALNWIGYAKEIGLDGLQLAAALHESDSYIPPEAMLDPVAAHLAVRTLPDGTGTDLSDEHAGELISACQEKGIKIYDLGFFENLLHPDDRIRNQIHKHLLRVARAAQKLESVGCGGVTTFIGYDHRVSMDENLLLFEKYVIPLLRQFEEMGLRLWIENCPMPGWDTHDNYVKNLAYCPALWILMLRMAEEKHNVLDTLYITYDGSHDILMGTTPQHSFRILQAAGCQYVLNRFHVKDQNRNLAKVAAHTMLGQRVGLGIRTNGVLTTEPSELGRAWGRMTAAHTLPGLSQYNPGAMAAGLKIDWLAHQLAARRNLSVEAEDTVVHIEHEWGPCRTQDVQQVLEALQLSVQFMRGVDMAADAVFRSQEWVDIEGLPWQTYPPSLLDAALEQEIFDEVQRIKKIPV